MKREKIIFGLALVASIAGGFLEINDGLGDPFPAEPLYLLGGAIVIPSIIVLIRKCNASAWSRFAVWGTAISAFLIIITPKTSGAWMAVYFIDKKQITLILAVGLLLTGLVIALWPRRR